MKQSLQMDKNQGISSPKQGSNREIHIRVAMCKIGWVEISKTTVDFNVKIKTEPFLHFLSTLL